MSGKGTSEASIEPLKEFDNLVPAPKPGNSPWEGGWHFELVCLHTQLPLH